MKLYNVSPVLIISLFANYINTLEELILHTMYELNPLPYDDLRLLVKNNQKLNHMELYTIEGARVLNQEELDRFRSNGELPRAEEYWIPELV
ncbi:hypothetical protein GLOIN_2v1677723 [Rhizophagus clarus]|nr:hypothetical protein GLOIN_2v1677723 [Rhizophagus clarus]